MEPGWFDHALAVILVVLVPIEGAWMMRRLAAAIAAGTAVARLREYLITMAIEWGLVAVVIVNWVLAGRSLEAIGLSVPATGRTVAGLVVTALVLVLMIAQWRAIQRLDAAGWERLGRQFGDATALLPVTRREAIGFRFLAITAGVCEEVLYRGFLIWYFATWLGIWPAALVGAVGFGLAHWYQGWKGVVKTGTYGLLMGVLYLLTGSLVWPMVIHAVVDLQGGAIGRRVLGDRAAPQSVR